MTISKTWRARLATLAVAGLVLAACGGDDDDAAPEAGTEEGAATGDQADDEDQDEITVDDLNDMPDECVDAVGELLERIEPIVEDVDWENADLEDLGDIGEQLEAEASDIGDDELEARCSQYTFAGDGDLDALIELAQDRAPGVVSYLEFIKGFQEDISDISIPDISVPDISLPDVSLPAISIPDISVPEGAPANCDEAVAYIEDLMDQYDNVMDLDINQLTAMGSATSVLSQDCSIQEVQDFFGRQDVTDFMAST